MVPTCFAPAAPEKATGPLDFVEHLGVSVLHTTPPSPLKHSLGIKSEFKQKNIGLGSMPNSNRVDTCLLSGGGQIRIHTELKQSFARRLPACVYLLWGSTCTIECTLNLSRACHGGKPSFPKTVPSTSAANRRGRGGGGGTTGG